MKKKLLRAASLLLACLLTLLCTVSCANRGKTLLSIKKDGYSATLSVNLYELMMTRMKGMLYFSEITNNGVDASNPLFWEYQDTYNGKDLQTIDEYYRDSILENCKTYLAALYLCKVHNVTLSASEQDKIDARMEELVKTDGDGSKTKLNATLSPFAVNYNILRDAYELDALIQKLKDTLYGQNAALIGNNLKNTYLQENFVHFRQIFLATYNFVYERDEFGNDVYYYPDGESKGRIYYDVYNGAVGLDKDGKEIKDDNGDTVYFVKGSDQKEIAYDTVNGVREPLMVGTEQKTEEMTKGELDAVAAQKDELLLALKNSTNAEFEAKILELEKENNPQGDNSSTGTQYDDGIYLSKKIDYTTVGFAHFDKIIAALDEMEVGEVTCVQSSFGYHIIKKYEHTENAFEKEGNEDYFANDYFNFYDDMVDDLMLAECQKYYDDIVVSEKVLEAAPKMRDVAVNSYYYTGFY